MVMIIVRNSSYIHKFGSLSDESLCHVNQYIRTISSSRSQWQGIPKQYISISLEVSLRPNGHQVL